MPSGSYDLLVEKGDLGDRIYVWSDKGDALYYRNTGAWGSRVTKPNFKAWDGKLQDMGYTCTKLTLP